MLPRLWPFDYVPACWPQVYLARRTIADFRADPGVKTAASREYLRNCYAGDASALLKPFWPEYACVLASDTAEGFRSCACAGSKTR